MSKETIINKLATLPPDKLAEVEDFIDFLAARNYQQPIDESTQWSDEDLDDWTNASLNHADENL